MRSTATKVVKEKHEKNASRLRKITFNVAKDLHKKYSQNNFNHQEILSYLQGTLGIRVMDFVSSYVDVDSSRVRSMYLVSPFNVATLPRKRYQGIVNACPINHNKAINETLKTVNEKLDFGSYYIGNAETYATRKKIQKRKFGFLYFLVAPIDFILNRVFAKLKWSKSLYLKIMRGDKPSISKTETFGRIIKAGFEIVDFKEINNTLWYVAKKITTPDLTPIPEYGVLYKKRCIGKNGKTIEITKVRTMHPYAEYLQSYMIDKHGYSNNADGKISNDYRVTKWGKIIRRLYLDEIPQLWSVAKGEMSLIGVRPITKARLNEFPPELVKARQQFKPGCIPPYVSLRMGDELGNLKAEWIYIRAKQKHGILIDFKFFFMGIYNILTGRMLSA